MGKFIRYALATVCFAASVGCLALWARSHRHRDVVMGPSAVFPGRVLGCDALAGIASVQLVPQQSVPVTLWTEWVHYVQQTSEWDRELLEQFARENGRFGMVEGGETGKGVRFPLWYPALALALAGVGVLRSRWKFSIRSAMIVVSAVAALMGIAVAL